MDQSHVVDLIDDLSSSVDELKSTLTSLTGQNGVSKYAETLPLLDRAKLYTTTAYAIESLIYNHLRLANEDAKDHPVMTELSRVKQYFERVMDAENPGRNARPEGVSTVDKAAARRFIQHGVSGNKRLNDDIAAKAKQKLEAMGTSQPVFAGKKRKFDDAGQHLPDAPAASSPITDFDEQENNDKEQTTFIKPATWTQPAQVEQLQSAGTVDPQPQAMQQEKKRSKNARRKERKRQRQLELQ